MGDHVQFSGVVVLSYDGAPPTSNKNNGVGGRGHPIAISKTKKLWQQIWGVELQRVRMPRGCRHVHAYFLVEYTTRNKRDSDNLIFPLSKPLADIMVQMRIIEDDDPSFYSFDRPEIQIGAPGLRTQARTTIKLEYALQGGLAR